MDSLKKHWIGLCLVAAAFAQGSWQDKTVRVGAPFKINLLPETPEDVFALSEVDADFLKILPETNQNSEDSKRFTLVATKAGETRFQIDRLLGTRVEKGWIRYRLNILEEPKAGAVSQAVAKKKNETKKKTDDEYALSLLAQRAAEAGLTDSALAKIDEYFQKFPTGTYGHPLARLKADLLMNPPRTNAAAAAQWLSQYAQRDLKDPQKAEALLWQGQALLSNHQMQAAAEPLFSLTTRYPNEVAGQTGLLETGHLLSDMKRFRAAVPYFQKYMEINPLKEGQDIPPRYDEAAYSLAFALENDSEKRDVPQATRFYEWILSKMPQSPWAGEAKKRLRFLRANYLEVR